MLFSKTAMKLTSDQAPNIARSAHARHFVPILPKFSLDHLELSAIMRTVLNQTVTFLLEVLLARAILLYVVVLQELRLMKIDLNLNRPPTWARISNVQLATTRKPVWTGSTKTASEKSQRLKRRLKSVRLLFARGLTSRSKQLSAISQILQ